MGQIETIFNAVIEGDAAGAKSGVQAALSAGMSAEAILKQGLIAAMDEVGSRFEAGEFYVPEMLIAARAMQAGLNLLKPLLASQNSASAGRVVIGTVKGDMHDIGKNLVAMMLEGAGFEIVDLGTDTAPEKFVQAVQAHAPQVIAMSALLTTTMPNMQVTIDALQAAGLRQHVKVIVGGAPVTEGFAKQIGADGYSADAGSAVRLTKSLIGTNYSS
jgi:5-methyltetrahydrofolate--homocysteine methyltransferase